MYIYRNTHTHTHTYTHTHTHTHRGSKNGVKSLLLKYTTIKLYISIHIYDYIVIYMTT
jgi:hypothetical protein